MNTATENRPTPLQAWIELQLARGSTVSAMAAQFGLPRSVVSHIRHGRRRMPRNRLLLAKSVTNLALEDLLA